MEILVVIMLLLLASLGVAPALDFFQVSLGKKQIPKSSSHLSFRTQVRGWTSKVRWTTEADVAVGTRTFRFPPSALDLNDSSIDKCVELAEEGVIQSRGQYQADPFLFHLEFIEIDGGRVIADFTGTRDKVTDDIARWQRILNEIALTLAPATSLFAPIPTLSCPDCKKKLRATKAALAKHVCDACCGVYLPTESAQTIIAESNFDVASLKNAAEGAEDGNECVHCDKPMKRVSLDDTITELCLHCGAMWLDKGELRTLSLGKYSQNNQGE